DKAYREVSKQVRIPGFRPGHVPPRVIDQRLGRGVVLEQAVNDAVPQLYGKALEDNDVRALGQPDLEITQLDDGQQLAFTYEVGSGSVLDGLDEALTGMSAGDASTFAAELAGGAHAGEQAEVAVTVHSVKVKELPELDDEFAQSASEYDTLGEFRAGTRTRLENVKRLGQVGQARDRALDAVINRLDIPLPDRIVASEVEGR